jgi:hypothetical protein
VLRIAPRQTADARLRFPMARSAANRGYGSSPLDRVTALGSILATCRRLRVGKAARLDRNVVRSAFPPGPDGRPLQVQLSELLIAARDGIFGCQLLPGGDHMVRREVRRELVPELQALVAALQ